MNEHFKTDNVIGNRRPFEYVNNKTAIFQSSYRMLNLHVC